MTSYSKQHMNRPFPIKALRDGLIVSPQMEMTLGWELELPCEGDLAEKDYESMMQSLTLAIRSLPPWIMTVRQDMFIPEKYHQDTSGEKSILGRQYFKHFEGRKYFSHRSYIYLTMTSEDMVSRACGSSIFNLRESHMPPSLDTVSEFFQNADRFIGCLTSSGIVKARRITDAMWSSIMDTYLCMGSSRGVMSEHHLGKDKVISRDTRARVYRIDYECGDTIDDTVQVSGVTMGRLSSLGIGLACPHVINSYILTLPQKRERQRLLRRIKRLNSVDFDIRSRAMRKEMEQYMEDSTQRLIVMGHTNVILWEDGRRSSEPVLVSAAAGLGYSVSLEKSLSAAIWFSGIPGTSSTLGMDNMRRMDLREQVSGCIWETVQRPLSGGNIMLCDRVRHIPVELDFQSIAVKAGIAENLNAFLLGNSGSGKSFLMNHLVRSMYDSGGNVTIIDIGDSYKVLAKIINEHSEGRDGIYNEWNESCDIRFSLFDGWRNWTTEIGEIAAGESGFSFLLTLLLRITECSGDYKSIIFPQVVSDLIRSYVCFLKESAASNPGAESTEASIDGFYHFLKNEIQPRIECKDEGYSIAENRITDSEFDMNGFCIQLSPFVSGGKYSSLFREDEKSRKAISSRFVVYELEKVASDPMLYPIVTLCILHRFERLMKENTDDGSVKTIVIEEAWKAIASKSSSSYITELWKTARKSNGSAVVVTQQWSDLESDIVKDTILCNSATKILMNGIATEESVDRTLSSLGIDCTHREIVLSLGKGLPYRNEPCRDVFISIGEKYAKAFSVEVSPAERLAYESSKTKKQKLLDFADRKGSITQALTELV